MTRDYLKTTEANVEVLNRASRDIPPPRKRLHLW